MGPKSRLDPTRIAEEFMDMNRKNIILLTGRNITGKTTYQRVLSQLLKPCLLVTDQVFYGDAILKDDRENQGRGHIHPESHREIFGVKDLEGGGHLHDKSFDDPLPAMSINNDIIHDMYGAFFKKINLVEADGYVLGELGGAKNAHQKGHPMGFIDCSFDTKTNLLKNGEYEISGLRKVLCCIHLRVDDGLRYKRLEARKDINLDVAKAMEIDDFEGPFSDLLESFHIPIERISNNEDLTDDQIATNLKILLGKYYSQ